MSMDAPITLHLTLATISMNSPVSNIVERNFYYCYLWYLCKYDLGNLLILSQCFIPFKTDM